MASKEKNLIKNTLLFSIGNAGAKLLMLIFVPLYTYYVSIEQMGQYDVVNTYIGLFSPLACLALYEGIYRWLLDNKESNKDILKSGIYTSIGVLIIFNFLAFFILKYIHYQYMFESILLMDTSALYTIAQFITRGLRNNKIYAVQGILYSIVLIMSNIIMVIGKQMQARGLLLSMAIAYFITTLFMIILQNIFGKYIIKGKFEKRLMVNLVKYSFPMVPNNIAWWLVAASNRLVINWGMGDASNGIYAISMKFPTLVNMLSTFFYQAWQEQAITEYNSKERDLYYTKIFNIYMKVLLTGIIVLFPITKIIIIHFMNSSYQAAYQYAGILYLSSVFSAFAGFYGTGYLSTKETSGALTTTIIGAVINMVITVSLIHRFGLYAAASGSMIGNVAIWSFRIIQTKKYFNIVINKKALFILLTLTVVANIVINMSNLIILIGLQVVFFMLFVFVNRDLIFRVIRLVRQK